MNRFAVYRRPGSTFDPARSVVIGGTVALIVLLFLVLFAAGWGLQRLIGGKPVEVRSAPRGHGSLGSAVHDGQFRFAVTEVSCGHTELWVNESRYRPEGEFCFAPLRVENIGNQPRHLADYGIRALLANGDTVRLDAWATQVRNPDSDNLGWLGAGSAVAFTAVFDVPPGQGIVKLELHDSPLSQGALLTIG